MVGVVLSGLLDLGTTSPLPVRRERRVSYSGELLSETPLPEYLATYAERAATTAGTPIQVELAESRFTRNTEQMVAGDPQDTTDQVKQVQEDPNSPPDQPADIKELLEAFTFAQIVTRVMPVHEDLDRRATRALRKRAAGQQPRKLSQK